MARTTQPAVAAIIELDATINVAPFIEAAAALVEEIAVDSGHDETRLELIERWLSAHFYTNRDPRPTSEKAGPVAVSYQSAVDLNLNTSHYGQTAMILDTSGLLRAMSGNKKRVVSVTWLGTPLEGSRVEET